MICSKRNLVNLTKIIYINLSRHTRASSLKRMYCVKFTQEYFTYTTSASNLVEWNRAVARENIFRGFLWIFLAYTKSHCLSSTHICESPCRLSVGCRTLKFNIRSCTFSYLPNEWSYWRIVACLQAKPARTLLPSCNATRLEILGWPRVNRNPRGQMTCSR